MPFPKSLTFWYHLWAADEVSCGSAKALVTSRVAEPPLKLLGVQVAITYLCGDLQSRTLSQVRLVFGGAPSSGGP